MPNPLGLIVYNMVLSVMENLMDIRDALALKADLSKGSELKRSSKQSENGKFEALNVLDTLFRDQLFTSKGKGSLDSVCLSF